MGETNLIPLFEAAARLAYGENAVSKWADLYPATKAVGYQWLLWVADNSPPQEYKKDEFGELVYIVKDCPNEFFKKKQREKIRSTLIKILVLASCSHEGFLKGTKLGQSTSYMDIPSDFVLSVKIEGLTLTSDLNSHSSKKLCFSIKNTLYRIVGVGGRYQYNSVLVDWCVLNEYFNSTTFKSKSETQELCLLIMGDLIKERGELKAGLSLNWTTNQNLYDAVWETWSKQYPDKSAPSQTSLKEYFREFKKRRKSARLNSS